MVFILVLLAAKKVVVAPQEKAGVKLRKVIEGAEHAVNRRKPALCSRTYLALFSRYPRPNNQWNLTPGCKAESLWETGAMVRTLGVTICL